MKRPQGPVKFTDGTSIAVDEAWETEQGIWYRQGGMSHLVSRDRIKAIERNGSAKTTAPEVAGAQRAVSPQNANAIAIDQPVWIYLVGGARVEADSATESAEGVWYRRGSLSVFIERARVDHVEREARKRGASALFQKANAGGPRETSASTH